MDEKTQKELETIEYLKANIDFNDPRAIKKLYNNLYEKNLFETKEGLAFMAELSDLCLATRPDDVILIKDDDSKSLQNESASSGPVKSGSNSSSKSAAKSSKKVSTNKKKKSAAVIKKAAAEKRSVKSGDEVKEVIPTNKGSRRRVSVAKYRLSLIFNVIFLVSIIFMFCINSTINSPNILNYEVMLQDRYASWEQDLVERENSVIKREQKLLEKEKEFENKKAEFSEFSVELSRQE